MPTSGELWLLLAGAVAASVNAAAGGGTLLSFPALLAAGLSPLAANATSTVGLLPGSLASVWAYRGELRRLGRDTVLIAVPSVLGGALGAWLLLFLGSKVFATVVPGLLLVAAALLVLQPLLARWLQRRDLGSRPQRALPLAHASAFALGHGPPLQLAPTLLGASIISIYAGYFGAGAGIMFLGTMGLLLPRSLADVNALKVFCAAVANGVGALTFVVLEARHPTGALVFRDAFFLAIGSVLGGYVGVKVVRKLPAWALRAFAASVGTGIAIYLVVR